MPGSGSGARPAGQIGRQLVRRRQGPARARVVKPGQAPPVGPVRPAFVRVTRNRSGRQGPRSSSGASPPSSSARACGSGRVVGRRARSGAQASYSQPARLCQASARLPGPGFRPALCQAARSSRARARASQTSQASPGRRRRHLSDALSNRSGALPCPSRRAGPPRPGQGPGPRSGLPSLLPRSISTDHTGPPPTISDDPAPTEYHRYRSHHHHPTTTITIPLRRRRRVVGRPAPAAPGQACRQVVRR